MELMNKEFKLVKKIKTFLEVNIDYNIWQDNIFKIDSITNKINELFNPDKHENFIERISD